MGGVSRRAFTVAALSAFTAAPGASAAAATGPAAKPAPSHSAAAGMRGMWLATAANHDWPTRAGCAPQSSVRN